MIESTITIKSGKVLSQMFLQYSFEEKKEACTETVTKKSDLPIHDDCQQAYVNLIPHLILLCEQELVNETIEKAINNGIDDIEEDTSYFKDYRVSEFKITGSANSEGVVISGKRYLTSGKSIVLSTPFIRWDDEDYKFISEFTEAVEALREEVYQYYNGKHAPMPKQESFDFGEDNMDEPLNKPFMKIAGDFKKIMEENDITISVSAASNDE
ncbi:hypothetical protein [Lutibacter maritimus]|uniref:Uncharacterized protein n=1 Tax=Lutibacter maritimus TaxID=593133 RepID=A0A1I6NRH5_9FLAO|nr:hypothetical protein [Lutibacter maritimus]SFS30503.1 hypothetical protein SAMN04488006_0445 [Lutibacter maritimus]